MHVVLAPPKQTTWFWRRGFPLLIAATIVVILLTSAVQRNLWVVSGPLADAIMLSYAALLVYVGFFKVTDDRVHQLGAMLAVLTWGGRGGGFVELSIDRGTWDLGGAVAERLLLATSLVLWHASMSFQVATERELDHDRPV